MVGSLKYLIVIGVLLASGWSTAEAQDRRGNDRDRNRTARRDRSDNGRRDRSHADRHDRGSRDHASQGSVRNYRPSRQATPQRSTNRRTTGSREADRRREEVRPPNDQQRRVVHIEHDRTRRGYDQSTRYVASRGSIRNYHPTHLPARPVYDHEVRVRRVPRYGTRCYTLPPSHRVVTYRRHQYYDCDGVYYRRYHNEYVAVRPPLGIHLAYLPEGSVTIRIGGRSYYRYENTYYVREIIDALPSYVVVRPPREVFIDVLPPDCHEIIYRGRRYYVDIYDEIAYEPILVDSRTAFRPAAFDVDVEFDDGRIEIEIDD